MIPVRRALVSVSDKTGLTTFARGLKGLGVEIISTGGTARALSDAGIDVIEVKEVTGFSEILDGRVKTLHPKIHGAILAKREETHLRQLEEQGISPIDLVVVNLYPFLETLKRTSQLEEIVEQIDIGGPTLIRAAAKNHRYVVVVANPTRYEEVLSELEHHNGFVSEDLSLSLAEEAFSITASYDALIHRYFCGLQGRRFPDLLNLSFQKIGDLRYGENPHQAAAFYRDPLNFEATLSDAEVIQGKDLSYNNILDLEAALQLIREFKEPCGVVIKHNNPCGVSLAETLSEAYLQAREADPVSAFGSVVGLNRKVNRDTAKRLTETFVEAVLAPDFDSDALEVFMEKKALRVLKIGGLNQERHGGISMAMRKVDGGLLFQEEDQGRPDQMELKVVTKKSPSDEERRDLLFAMKVAKHVRSNAIVLAKGRTTIGIGAGQMSRLDSVRIATEKAGDRARGACLASDAFFPFKDGVLEASRAGILAIIQPGGSVRDKEVIEAADECGISMVFTGMRHFRH